ncbi:MAG: hypothetical protein WAV11_00080 [Minisyncoccia bacterium]
MKKFLTALFVVGIAFLFSFTTEARGGHGNYRPIVYDVNVIETSSDFLDNPEKGIKFIDGKIRNFEHEITNEGKPGFKPNSLEYRLQRLECIRGLEYERLYLINLHEKEVAQAEREKRKEKLMF